MAINVLDKITLKDVTENGGVYLGDASFGRNFDFTAPEGSMIVGVAADTVHDLTRSAGDRDPHCTGIWLAGNFFRAGTPDKISFYRVTAKLRKNKPTRRMGGASPLGAPVIK